MKHSLLYEVQQELAHPKPDCAAERRRKKLARAERRRQARLEVFALDKHQCQWCGARDCLDPCHIENKRAHNPELDTPANMITLCGRIPGTRIGCHYIFDEGGKVNGKKVTANQFRIMVFERHENDPTFRHRKHLELLKKGIE